MRRETEKYIQRRLACLMSNVSRNEKQSHCQRKIWSFKFFKIDFIKNCKFREIKLKGLKIEIFLKILPIYLHILKDWILGINFFIHSRLMRLCENIYVGCLNHIQIKFSQSFLDYEDEEQKLRDFPFIYFCTVLWSGGI